MSEKGTRLRTSRALAAYLPAALSVVLAACTSPFRLASGVR